MSLPFHSSLIFPSFLRTHEQIHRIDSCRPCRAAAREEIACAHQHSGADNAFGGERASRVVPVLMIIALSPVCSRVFHEHARNSRTHTQPQMENYIARAMDPEARQKAVERKREIRWSGGNREDGKRRRRDSVAEPSSPMEKRCVLRIPGAHRDSTTP